MCYENYKEELLHPFFESSQWFSFTDFYDSVITSIINKTGIAITTPAALPNPIISKHQRFPPGSYICSTYGVWTQLFKTKDLYETLQALKNRTDILDRFSLEGRFHLHFVDEKLEGQ